MITTITNLSTKEKVQEFLLFMEHNTSILWADGKKPLEYHDLQPCYIFIDDELRCMTYGDKPKYSRFEEGNHSMSYHHYIEENSPQPDTSDESDAPSATTEQPRLKIAFDVDDTLIVPSVATGLQRDTPNYETIQLFKYFQSQGHHMIIWSGSGRDWARHWNEVLGLQADEIRDKKASPDVAICFDDCDVKLAKVNVKVKRVNNRMSRAEWNTTKHTT